ncbi:MAG TPA: cytochrome c [Acidobacteriaceae bacterium]|jgi:mono/diheme cytochrome c family protein
MNRTMLIVVSFVAGVLLLPLAALVYLKFGKPPVATADKPFPMEQQIVKIPLEARIHRELPSSVPIAASDENLNAGAGIYEDKCEMCHGTADEMAAIGKTMFPMAPQLWVKHKNNDAVGVSDDPVGETYWRVKNGIRLTGMPAYGTMLTETQMWQVSLLLSMADKPLPAEAAKTVGK